MEGQGNPAAIGAQVPSFRLYVTPIDLTFGNNTWPLADIDYYLDKYIPAEARRQFIDDIPEDSFRLTGQGLAAVQLGIGSLSASAGVRAPVVGVADDVLELVLFGNELEVPYSLSGTSLEAQRCLVTRRSACPCPSAAAPASRCAVSPAVRPRVRICGD